jgi:hypothetical protein
LVATAAKHLVGVVIEQAHNVVAVAQAPVERSGRNHFTELAKVLAFHVVHCGIARDLVLLAGCGRYAALDVTKLFAHFLIPLHYSFRMLRTTARLQCFCAS